jgi:outer membrane PBP1 activator LpoA protein
MLRFHNTLLLCLTVVSAVLAGCKSVPLWGPDAAGATSPRAPVTDAAPAATPPLPTQPAIAAVEPAAQVETFPLGTAPITPEGAAAPVTPVTPPLTGASSAPSNIALILPLNSPDFIRAAEAVKDGFDAATGIKSDNPIPVLVYPVNNEGAALAAAYTEAVTNGARCVVAGLTRDGANTLALAASTVPTLVLNAMDRAGPLPPQMFSFSLSLEAEARQVARLAASNGYRSVDVLSSGTALARRVYEAFEQEWQNLGGQVVARFDISRDLAQVANLKAALQAQPADALFIAADSTTIKAIRPSLSMSLPTFTTSQVNDGKMGPANIDLQGIQFVDMPWLVQPDYPAVAAYPRPAKPLAADLERFYALGIDAYRLAAGLARTGGPSLESVDGVTGKITLTDQHTFQRELTPVRFEEGQLVVINSPLR